MHSGTFRWFMEPQVVNGGGRRLQVKARSLDFGLRAMRSQGRLSSWGE